MDGCREICKWARACDLPGDLGRNPEDCERAELLKRCWKTTEAMNAQHDYLEMRRKVEDEQ